MTAGGADKSQKYHKCSLQYSTFASERSEVRTWGRQTCFLPRAPSNLVTPLSATFGGEPKRVDVIGVLTETEVSCKNIFVKHKITETNLATAFKGKEAKLLRSVSIDFEFFTLTKTYGNFWRLQKSSSNKILPLTKCFSTIIRQWCRKKPNQLDSVYKTI